MVHEITYSARARWCPSRSLLGRFFLRGVDNRQQQAEAWYIIAISSIIVAVVIVQFISWSLLAGEIAANSRIAMWYWIGQLALGSLILIGGFLGYCPPVNVGVTENLFRVHQGKRSIEFNLASLTGCRIVPALHYYRHWRRRGDVEHFMTHVPSDVLLIFYGQGCIAIGIDSDVHADLIVALNKPDTVEVAAPNVV
ncbi:MAG: hypothetical protein OXL40_00115 [Bacteroidota bacterium]|nr:hypothetical protein [Bacteroidota bacterium]